jgi:DNA polymerase-4
VQVRDADPAVLTATVGSLADWLRRLSHGDDPRAVTPDRPWKSVSAETTYASDLRDLPAMHTELGQLAHRVARSLRDKSLRARTVTIKVRYADFVTVTRSHTDETPTCDKLAITRRASLLLERTEAGARPVRLLGVGTHGLVAGADTAPASGLLALDPAGKSGSAPA